jgi:hypothetical protein
MAPRLIKFIFKTNSGCTTVRVPYFSADSSEFAGLEEFYGSAFLKHVLPDFYDFKSNVVKVKEFIETRFVNFEGLSEFDHQSVRLLLTKWQDSSAALKLSKYNDPREAFRRAAAFKSLCELNMIQGFNAPVSSALSRLRQRNCVLVLIEPGGILLHRRSEPVDTLKPLTRIQSKFYYMRPGAKALLRSLRDESQCCIAFYSAYEANKLTQLFKRTRPRLARLTEDFSFFGRRHCGKSLQSGKPRKDLSRIWSTSFAKKRHFGAHNTVLVDWNCEVTRDYSANVLLVPRFDEHGLLNCPSRRALEHLRSYLKGLLAKYEYDVRSYMDETPFVPYS